MGKHIKFSHLATVFVWGVSFGAGVATGSMLTTKALRDLLKSLNKADEK